MRVLVVFIKCPFFVGFGCWISSFSNQTDYTYICIYMRLYSDVILMRNTVYMLIENFNIDC